jgi:hypothetical protein
LGDRQLEGQQNEAVEANRERKTSHVHRRNWLKGNCSANALGMEVNTAGVLALYLAVFFVAQSLNLELDGCCPVRIAVNKQLSTGKYWLKKH